jgi:hypothetical protein
VLSYVCPAPIVYSAALTYEPIQGLVDVFILAPNSKVKTEELLNGRDNRLSPGTVFSLSCQKGIYSRPKVNLPAPRIPLIKPLLTSIKSKRCFARPENLKRIKAELHRVP